MEKLRAVIYNRCSTEEESQRDALTKQVQESKNCIREKGWELTGSYVEAKSGTTSKGRREYNRLFQDLETDAFDIIVIKSQDRLMRNTKDWYLFLDRMQKNNKRLYMYLEQKFYTPDDALITGIKAILAEEYSRELSKKINNAHRNRQQEGQCFVITNQTYGYRKLADKSIGIDEEEAEMIRMIFQLAAEGYGTHCSAEILYQNGYRNRRGNMLSSSSLCKILRNPLYKGDVIQNRKHYDFESKRICKNPEKEWVIHTNAVPAIIDKDLFEAANLSMDMRRAGKNKKPLQSEAGKAGSYGLSGKLYCGLCGKPYYRTYKLRKQDKVVEWKCSTYLQKGRKNKASKTNKNRKVMNGHGEGCDNVHINEEKLYHVLEETAGNKFGGPDMKKEALLDETIAILEEVFRSGNICSHSEAPEAELNKIHRQKDVLLGKLLDCVISDEDYKAKNEQLQKREQEIENRLKQTEHESSPSGRRAQRIPSIRRSLENVIIAQAKAAAILTEIESITVFTSYMEIHFRTRESMTVMQKGGSFRIP